MDFKDLKIVFLPTKIYKVDSKLLRGNAVFSPTKVMRLKHNHVNRIIDLRNNERKSTVILKKLEKFYCKLFGIKYENLPCSISAKSVPGQDFFDKINKKIVENNMGKTYLHCHYGYHRTNMCVAMYEKYLGRNNEKIVKNLVKNFLGARGKKEYLWDHNKESLNLFLEKYFPPKNFV